MLSPSKHLTHFPRATIPYLIQLLVIFLKRPRLFTYSQPFGCIEYLKISCKYLQETIFMSKFDVTPFILGPSKLSSCFFFFFNFAISNSLGLLSFNALPATRNERLRT